MRGQMTHLDTDVLAEFDAGLVTGRRGARIAAHLAGCDRCRALRDELAGVSAASTWSSR
jgi:predicted anti-sigma-YlaC factor YlaD